MRFQIADRQRSRQRGVMPQWSTDRDEQPLAGRQRSRNVLIDPASNPAFQVTQPRRIR